MQSHIDRFVIEYGLIAALIAIGIVAVVWGAAGRKLRRTFR